MPDLLKASPPAAGHPPAPRAARLKRFQREQLIVGDLNRGVSVAEIAARIGVGEKRTRAVMRDILARRLPHPPMEFVAIQVSRLNEAMLYAFSAMPPSNLKAVDQVVKIVRELDRYGGAFAAEWARPEDPRLDAPDDEDAAFARAWLHAEPALQDLEAEFLGRPGCDRPENPAQRLEKIESAPEVARQCDGTSPDRRLASPPPPGPRLRAPGRRLLRGRDRVGGRADPSYGTEKDAELLRLGATPLLDPPPQGGRKPHDDRPEILAQDLEKVEFAPGIGIPPRTADAAAADPVSAPGFLALLRSAAGRQDLRACLNRLRSETSRLALGLTPQDRGGDIRSPVREAALARKTWRKALKRLNPRPEIARLQRPPRGRRSRTQRLSSASGPRTSIGSDRGWTRSRRRGCRPPARRWPEKSPATP